MRKVSLVVIVAALFASTAAFSVKHQRRWTEKLDLALVQAARQRGSEPVRTLIRVRPDARDQVVAHLELRGLKPERASTPDLIAVQMPASMLRPIAGDRDVVRMSSDAVVRGLASDLGKNTLLGTQGLLKLNGTSWSLATPYKGGNVGVAVIDSGVASGIGDLSAITFYDVINNMKQGGQYDDFGHGTHVSGLVASNGSFSNYIYQGVAPSVQLIEMKVLNSSGAGYTSDVINAINYVVANRSRLHLGVINLSLGHPIYESAATDPLVQAVENAVAQGIVVVVAAGNFGGDPTTHEVGYAGITSPGNAPSAITVGAVETFQTNSRGDDTIPWYSSRGPTWIDAYQKPDVVAPGSHLVSDISTKSTIYKTYPNGIVKANGKLFLKLSGTSMAAPVVSGIVAAMLEANRTKHPGAPLTPNAVKAILQYTAIPLSGYDELTQGTGAVNALGAIVLAEAVDPNAPISSNWLTKPISPYTTIDGESLPWAQHVVWGDHLVWGNQIYNNEAAWGLHIVWGDHVVWGDHLVWGNSTVWDGNQYSWGTHIVWGDSLIGHSTGNNIQWGGLDSTTTADHVVWGDLKSVVVGSTALSWGNLERANMDVK